MPGSFAHRVRAPIVTAARSGQSLLLPGLLLFACSLFFGFWGPFSQDSEAAPAPPRLALLFRVGEYPQTGRRPWAKLRTREEVQALRAILINRHGFLEQDVQVLENEQASGRPIREAFLQHLIARAQRGAQRSDREGVRGRDLLARLDLGAHAAAARGQLSCAVPRADRRGAKEGREPDSGLRREPRSVTGLASVARARHGASIGAALPKARRAPERV
jgi:hypothetical protein